MTSWQSSAAWPDNFGGVVKLFPLPNLVLFPNVAQPLHIFEPRYCALLVDALASDSLIAMAILEPNWEGGYDQRPDIAQTVCVGKIISHAPGDDGTHNILLIGLKRARIKRELDCSRLYRTAEVELLDDLYLPDGQENRPALVRRLQELFLQFVHESSAQEGFKHLIDKKLPLGVLTDTITYATNLPPAIKLQLLAENNVDIRCRLLTRCLEQKINAENNLPGDSVSGHSAVEKFPPPFSEN